MTWSSRLGQKLRAIWQLWKEEEEEEEKEEEEKEEKVMKKEKANGQTEEYKEECPVERKE